MRNLTPKPCKKAAASGIEESVSMILERGANLNARGSEGKTALHSAASAGHTRVVQLFIDSGADISATDARDKTSLFLAVEKGDELMVEQLLEEGADIEARSSQGETPLLHAAATGQLGTVKILLSYLADPNAKRNASTDEETGSPRNSYYNPLQAAAAEGFGEIVEELLTHNVNIEAEDDRKRRALHYAAENGHSTIVSLLLDWSCKPDAKDSEATNSTSPRCSKWMLRSGQKVARHRQRRQ